MARIAKVVRISAQELDRVKQNRNRIVGIPRKYLEEKAKTLTDQGEWALFIDVVALLLFWPMSMTPSTEDAKRVAQGLFGAH